MGDWKLVAVPHTQPWQLFDLAADPTESNDLAPDNPDRVAELDARFEKWRTRVGAR